MRYHEFKVINEGFWDNVLDLLQGGTTADVAQKKWIEGLYQTMSASLENGIRSGIVNPRLTTKLDPKNPQQLIDPTDRTDKSISQYIYSLITKKYRDLPLSNQNREHLITAINKVQDDYSVDKGKKAMIRLGAVISTISNSGEKEPAPIEPPAPPSTIVPKGIEQYPTTNIIVRARVGDRIQKFRFSIGNKQWKDQTNAVITDAESINALNSIAKSQTKSPTP